MPKPYPPCDLGQLPVDTINRTLGTELLPGPVRLSTTAHQHAAKDHPDDYPVCEPLIQQVISDPAFIGQAPRHARDIELLRRVPGGSGDAVLVAVGIEMNEAGNYAVRSFYLITEAELSAKRQRGHIRLAHK